MPFNPTNCTLGGSDRCPDSASRLQDEAWQPILQNSCDFDPSIFEDITLNLIRNPNINSSHLFRADILYDSKNNEYTNVQWPAADLQRLRLQSSLAADAFPGFQLQRTLIRQMIPRNPQLDKPIVQICHLLRSKELLLEKNLVVYTPDVADITALPWYHPAVQSLAYLHSCRSRSSTPGSRFSSHETLAEANSDGTISLHYRLFPSQTFPLPLRLLRTAHNLLATLYKHGQGKLSGYVKQGHHDQLVSQQRVQDTYTELKRLHAKRLCDAWVEQTEPTKHVFEDLGIAAFLIELWKDMYQAPGKGDLLSDLPPFPGFVDIGCGNGVLTEILLLSGYKGWGFDARRRKTWSILSPDTRENLHELVLVPQTFFDIPSPSLTEKISLLSRLLSNLCSTSSLLDHPQFPSESWHNGIFPTGTFIISNHADELTPWTPLLASISNSPFLAIPCCSHNLSGQRFRAPSHFNSHSADSLAPAYFAKNIKRSKSVAISVVTTPVEEDDEFDQSEKPSLDFLAPSRLIKPESGDLKALSQAARSKQPSAYSSLCDWVSHLASEVGYIPEREMLRIPSTRNVGIVGRTFVNDKIRSSRSSSDSGESTPSRSASPLSPRSLKFITSRTPSRTPSRNPLTRCSSSGSKASNGSNSSKSSKSSRREENEQLAESAKRRELVIQIAKRENADGSFWIDRCIGLGKKRGDTGH
ncbi:MAG: tRNA(Ser) Um(44) 2'-O-methyltransferase [Icmadophila ericetorum]|nr:tRNA(Ser) Um(44) 2'-O-methyltransferase [Icmadophila ericetorum]